MESEALDSKSTHNSNAQLSEKYLPFWKCSKRLFHLRLTEWSVWLFWIQSNFQVTKNQQEQQQKTNKKALQTSTRSKRSHLVHFTNKHSRHGQSTHRKARREPAIRDAQKLAQNVFPPWTLRGEGEGRKKLRLPDIIVLLRNSVRWQTELLIGAA